MVTETRIETGEERKDRALNKVAYKFRDKGELSEAQLTDPDYRVKALAIESGQDPNKMLICSKCHHCR